MTDGRTYRQTNSRSNTPPHLRTMHGETIDGRRPLPSARRCKSYCRIATISLMNKDNVMQLFQLRGADAGKWRIHMYEMNAISRLGIALLNSGRKWIGNLLWPHADEAADVRFLFRASLRSSTDIVHCATRLLDCLSVNNCCSGV